MFSKIILSVSCLLLINSIIMQGSDCQKYAAQDLAAARAEWLGQESRVKELKFEACEYATDNEGQDYVCGVNQGLRFNDSKQQIVTLLPNGRKVILSYEKFTKFITNDALRQAAREVLIMNVLTSENK